MRSSRRLDNSGSALTISQGLCCVLLGLLSLVSTPSAADDAVQSLDGEDYYQYEAGYLSDRDSHNSQWQQMLTGRSQPPKCIDIPSDLSLCRDLQYTRMRLPNLLDHETIGEVIDQAKSWVSLLGIRCHPDTQVFLCSLFSPVCLEKKIWPCRELCEAVKAGCEQYMMKYGYPWPDMVRCDQFPLENLCIGLQHDVKPDETMCEPCSKPNTVEGIVDSYCSADFAIRIKIKEDVITHNDMKLTAFDKKRMYKKGSLKKRDIRGESEFFIKDGANCECERIEGSTKKVSYLLMGSKVDERLEVSYIQVFDQSDSDLKKALRAIRKQTNICDGGLNALAVRDQPKQERTRNRKRKPETGEEGEEEGEERKGKRNKEGREDRAEGEQREDREDRGHRQDKGDRKSRTRGDRNRDRERDSTRNEAKKLDLGPT